MDCLRRDACQSRSMTASAAMAVGFSMAVKIKRYGRFSTAEKAKDGVVPEGSFVPSNPLSVFSLRIQLRHHSFDCVHNVIGVLHTQEINRTCIHGRRYECCAKPFSPWRLFAREGERHRLCSLLKHSQAHSPQGPPSLTIILPELGL